MKPIPILFAGSPEIAVPSLEKLLLTRDEGWEVVGILTKSDTPKGRSGTPTQSAVGEAASRLCPGIPVLKPARLDGEVMAGVAALRPALLVSFAYGKIFPAAFLGLFPLGGINIHPSLLPRYRGPAPLQAALLENAEKTGVTIQRLAVKMDAGDIIMQETVTLAERETTESLSRTVAHIAAGLLVKTLAAGIPAGRPQNEAEASYCRLITREDGAIDWNKSAVEIDAQIRAYTPWPLSFTRHEGQELFILEARPVEDTRRVFPSGACFEMGGIASRAVKAAVSDTPWVSGTVAGSDKRRGIFIQTGDGVLAVTRLQYRTRKPLDHNAFLNGAKNFVGARLT